MAQMTQMTQMTQKRIWVHRFHRFTQIGKRDGGGFGASLRRRGLRGWRQAQARWVDAHLRHLWLKVFPD